MVINNSPSFDPIFSCRVRRCSPQLGFGSDTCKDGQVRTCLTGHQDPDIKRAKRVAHLAFRLHFFLNLVFLFYEAHFLISSVLYFFDRTRRFCSIVNSFLPALPNVASGHRYWHLLLCSGYDSRTGGYYHKKRP